MLETQNIYPLSDFQRNAKGFISQLKESQKPIVLTVNGKASLVIQDPESYQKLLEASAVERSAAVIRQRVQQFEIDCIDEDAKEALETLRGDLGISR